MPAKTGPKPKLTASDSARVKAMIEQRCSDAQIAQAFNVSRQTINRLRHYLAENQPKPVNELARMIACNAAGHAYPCAACE